MGFGFAGNTFALKIVMRDGDGSTNLGTVAIPAKTAKALNKTGGDGIQMAWQKVQDDKQEIFETARLNLVTALKGAGE
jgi:hypothetical protein